MSITEERMQTIDFSDKYYNTPAMIAGAKGVEMTPDAAGLTGKIIGNSVLAFGQIVAIAALAILGLLVTGQRVLLGGLGGSVVWFVVFFAVVGRHSMQCHLNINFVV